MRAHSLKYGFFSTYRYTVFVRRTAIDCFELSLPIHEEASNPSVRECMAGFCAIIASDSGKFEEPSDFNEQNKQMLLSCLSTPIRSSGNDVYPPRAYKKQPVAKLGLAYAKSRHAHVLRSIALAR